MNLAAQILVFLADALAGFFGALFLLRFAMQAFRVSFSGPVGHFVVTLTDWAVRPLRRAIPGLLGLDLASLVAALALQALVAGLLFGLLGGVLHGDGLDLVLAILWAALRGTLRLAVYLLIGVLIVQAVLSWVNPYSPLAGPANQLTRPFLAPIRKVLPTFSGIDLSPLVAILLAQVVLMVL